MPQSYYCYPRFPFSISARPLFLNPRMALKIFHYAASQSARTFAVNDSDLIKMRHISFVQIAVYIHAGLSTCLPAHIQAGRNARLPRTARDEFTGAFAGASAGETSSNFTFICKIPACTLISPLALGKV